MRSIYQIRGSDCYPTMELSAPSGQRIAFFDSVYSDLGATIILNRDYEIGGVIQEAKGDILISGATMKEDLTAIKGSLPTEEELNNSLSSELHGEVTLYGGRLRIEDGVRLTVLYFCTAEGSNATLLLKDAAMKGRAPLSGLYLSTGSTLDLQGINTITAGYLTMAEGTTMAFTLDYRNTSTAVLTMEAGATVTGTLNTDNLTLKLEGVDLANGIYKLITLQEPNTQYNYNLWTADRVSIEGLNACFNDMIWNNGTLYLLHQSDRNMPENRILIKKGDDFETRRDQDSVTFLIGDDVTVDSTEFKWWGDGEPLLTGKRILFTSSDQDSSYSMNSDGGSYKKRVRFVVSDDLFFDGLNNISLRDYVTADNESPGGAILFSASLRFSENNDISFIQNITSLHGGAISTSYVPANSILTFLNNGNIAFSENRSGGLGGAIMLHAFSSSEAASSVVNFTGNKNVLFSNNSASMNRESAEGGYSYAEGGAIYMYADSNTTAPTSILFFHNNGDVVFQGNFAQANDGIANGGAIGGYADCSFADNGDIKFINNYAISTSSLPDSCWGGAISLPSNSITFSACDDIQFCNNYMDLTCTSETAWASGGAISSGLSLTFISNKSISFNSNYCVSSGYAVGGAIGDSGQLELSFRGNTEVSFVLNHVEGTQDVRGGAIYLQPGSSLILQGAASFEKNYEIQNGEFRLRSIYQQSEEFYSSTMHLSAPTEKEICFRDGVFVGYESSIVLNKDYTLLNGDTQKADGDIIFSGETMSRDLKEIKGGFEPTVNELENSQSSELLGSVTLHGGRLRVEDGVKLTVGSFSVPEGSNATLLLKDATLISNSTIELSSGSSLSLEGANTIKSNSLTMGVDTVLSFTLGGINLSSAALTLNGALSAGSLSLNFEGTELKTGSYMLLTLESISGQYDPTNWTQGKISVSGLNSVFEDLTWKDGTLYLNYVANMVIDSGITSVDDDHSLGSSTITMKGGTMELNGHNLSRNNIVVKSGCTLDAGNGGTVKALTLDQPQKFSSLGNEYFDDATSLLTLKGSLIVNETLEVKHGVIGGKDASITAGAVAISGGTIDTKLLGTGGVTKTGSGEAKILGNQSYTGLTHVKGGTLSVYGSLGSKVQVDAGARLRLEGAFNGADMLLAQGARLVTKSGLSIRSGQNLSCSGTIVGDLTLAGGTVTATPSDFLSITGTLTLASNTRLVLSGSGWGAGSYDLFQFKNLSGSTDYATFFGLTDGSIAKVGDKLVLTLTQAPSSTLSLRTLGSSAENADEGSDEEATLASDADGATPGADDGDEGGTVIDGNDLMMTLREALRRSNVGHVAIQSTWSAAAAQREFSDLLRQRRLQGGTGTAWVSMLGGHSRMSGTGGSDVNRMGGALGVELTVSESGNIGLAAGSTWSRLNPENHGRLHQNAQSVGLYGNAKLFGNATDSVWLSWDAAYGRTRTHGPVWNGSESWTQQSAVLATRATWARMIGQNTAVQGFGGLEYLALDSAKVQGERTGSVQNLRGEIGAGITHNAGRASVYAEAALVGDMLRHNPVTTFDGIREQGLNPGRVGLKVSVGGSYRLNDTWSANAAYTLEAAEHNTQHSANIGVSHTF